MTSTRLSSPSRDTLVSQPCRWLPGALAIGWVLASVSAGAHIELDLPLVRHDQGDNGDATSGEINKQPPCGLGGSGDVRAPARVTMFTAGSTIVVEWRETIGHTGCYRVSFDDDGNDQEDFDANILFEVDDTSAITNQADGTRRWMVDVTLPSTPCTTCTLQVLQMMNGGGGCSAVTTPLEPTFNTYYQCADIILTAAGGGEGEGEGEPSPSGEGEGEGDPAPSGEGEGEGDPAPSGEGEGEGEDEPPPAGGGVAPSSALTTESAACGATRGAVAPLIILAGLLVTAPRRRRR